MSTLLLDKKIGIDQGIGGKANNLLKLDSLGITVPKWTVLPEEVLLEQLPQELEIEKIDNHLQGVNVPAELQAELASYFGSNYKTKTFAVRSSAIDEDGKDYSFAGQYESFLHVSFSDITEKIKAVWSSANSERVKKYRKQNNLPLKAGIGVIIQEMISPEVAGVAFGINPVTGDRTSKIVSSVYGLGEGLVSGELDADTYTITPDGIESKLAHKTHAFKSNGEGKGIKKYEVEKKKQDKSSLDEEQLAEISDVLDKLNDFLGLPQDIEFAYFKDQLYLLQTRPVTTKIKPLQEEYILWDNSNIIESYPGVTTPLTFSFIIKMYEFVYRQLAGLLGVRAKEVNQHAQIFANTLGIVRGRVYYNLLNWYKMLAMVPGFSVNAGYLEKMLGVKESFELEEKFQMSKGLARIRLFTMIIRMIFLHWKLKSEINKFQTHLNSVIKYYKSIDFNTLPPQEIISKYNVFEKSLLLQWKAPQINDFFAMIWFGILENLTKKYCGNNINLHNDLLCGSQDIISVEPVRKTIEIAQLVLSQPSATSLFKEESAKVIWQKLNQGNYQNIKIAIIEYLEKFGDRCVGELKLESISYSQDPLLYVKIVQSYVKQDIKLDKSNQNLEDNLRREAETTIFKTLKGQPFKKWVFNYVLRKTRNLVSNRENLRFERTRGYGMVRAMFISLGEQWHKLGKLDSPRDIFYLHLSEIKAMENQDFNNMLKAEIEARKEEFATYKLQDPPQERFYTHGVNFSDKYIYSTDKLESRKDYLSGIGCCPGKVQAKVQVIKSPDDLESLNGDILVTSSTDPGWITLFPTASAIIVERGSLLSHSAIVSREMGIPCIVSVKGLLRSLKSGDEVIMDGSTGEINVLR